jgi:hypothetical protein
VFRVQDDGHRFGAMSPQIPLIVSDRGTQSIAHHGDLPGTGPPSQDRVDATGIGGGAGASASVTKTAQSIRSAARGSAPGGLFVSALAASVKWLPDKGVSDSTRTTGISLASGIPPSLL